MFNFGIKKKLRECFVSFSFTIFGLSSFHSPLSKANHLELKLCQNVNNINVADFCATLKLRLFHIRQRKIHHALMYRETQKWISPHLITLFDVLWNYQRIEEVRHPTLVSLKKSLRKEKKRNGSFVWFFFLLIRDEEKPVSGWNGEQSPGSF